MILLFVLQFAVPLLLIAWIAIAPPRNLLGMCIQVIATTAGLVAIGLTGLWLLPPWWAPYAYGGLLALAVFIGLRRRWPFTSVPPLGPGAWIVAALFLALGIVAVKEVSVALAGRAPPPGNVVDLAFPLDGGTYLVVNGGTKLSINAHIKTLDTSVARFGAWRGQSYGVDIVQVDGLGLRAHGLQPSQPGGYLIYGSRVLTPCAGVVVSITDGLPDMQVPETDRANMAGNHVMLRCADADILLGHLRPGSLKVSIGTRVAAGDPIAAVGNSGNTAEPHLHIHAQRPGTADAPMSGDPLPIRLNGRFLVRSDRLSVP